MIFSKLLHTHSVIFCTIYIQIFSPKSKETEMYAGRIIVRVVFFPHYGSKGSFQYVSRDIFSLGFGPFRWVCTSGLSEDLRQTDAIATKVLQDIIKGLDKTS